MDKLVHLLHFMRYSLAKDKKINWSFEEFLDNGMIKITAKNPEVSSTSIYLSREDLKKFCDILETVSENA